MKVLTFQSKIPYGSNTHVVFSGDEAIVVDPAIDIQMLLALIDDESVKIKAVILTHSHFDHFLFIDSYYNSSIKIYAGATDIPALKDSSLNCYMQFLHKDLTFDGETYPLYEGDEISIGDEKLCVMHTPGHTRGSISLYSEGILISGDLIFDRGGYGRFDLPGGNYRELAESIDRVKRLPRGTAVYTGHGPNTVIN